MERSVLVSRFDGGASKFDTRAYSPSAAPPCLGFRSGRAFEAMVGFLLELTYTVEVGRSSDAFLCFVVTSKRFTT